MRLFAQSINTISTFCLAIVAAMALSGCNGQAALTTEAQQAPVQHQEAAPESAAKPALTFDSFAAMGDFGCGLPGQYALAAGLVRDYPKAPYTHMLLLGDLIYPDGDVKQFGEAYFTKPYKPLAQAGVQFIAALGNHDVLTTHTQASMAFFNMPARYYPVSLGAYTDVFVIDTNTFNSLQAAWLKTQLAQSRKPWRIVIGHHPVYSSGEHGNSNSLIKLLKPVLESAAQTSAQTPTETPIIYLAGHDHNYERFALKQNVQYIISGGGGASLRGFGKPESGSMVRLSVHHYLRALATADTLTLYAIDATGKTIDSIKLTKQDAAQAKPAA
ncbi:MAG: metallophosphoesterase [Vampirovibrionales bacterium]|nr:metallophosphoesterase [Vampirovibrionales bacterium]